MHDFSYSAYRTLITKIKQDIPLMDYAAIQEADPCFFVLRHDVEFSVEKAYELAKIEHEELGIQSSYFFQIRNYNYNPLAYKNLTLIKEMHAMGHKIGLHVKSYGLSDTANIAEFIRKDVDIVQNGMDLPIDRFSFHRPNHQVLALNIKIDGLINVYDKLFFHFHEDNKIPSSLRVHYYSDSQHRWKYGHPLSILEKKIKKIQLLIHPYSWSEQGLNNLDNFKALIELKQYMMLKAMQDECHHFPEELLQ